MILGQRKTGYVVRNDHRPCRRRRNMAVPGPPPCPQPQDFSILTGFLTPESDLPTPHGLDAGITMTVVDPGEGDEVIRIAETGDPFSVVVQWCICGPIVPALAGCWNVSLFINPIDGVAPTRGPLGTPKQVDVTSVPVNPAPAPESFQRCYLVRFDFPANTVAVGVYDLLATLTLSTGSCAAPGPLLGDTLGYAEIPVLVFFQD
jgi:hypothetical protein